MFLKGSEEFFSTHFFFCFPFDNQAVRCVEKFNTFLTQHKNQKNEKIKPVEAAKPPAALLLYHHTARSHKSA